MGIRATVNKIAELVTAVVPTNDPTTPFTRTEADTKGRVKDIIKDPARAITRQFVVRLLDQMPKDDGEAGTPAGRLSQLIAVQVVYKHAKNGLPVPWTQAQMAEDCYAIQNALQNVLNWDRPNTGIMSIVPAEQPTNEPLDSDEQEVGRLLTIPHRVIYREVNP